MSRTPRTRPAARASAVVALAALCLSAPTSAQVQVAPVPLVQGAEAGEPKPSSARFTIPEQRDARDQLRAILDYLGRTNIPWDVVTGTAQRLLDARSDSFYRLRDAKGDETGSVVSVRAKVNQILGDLPPAGRQFYEQEYGGAASKLLKQALDAGYDRAQLSALSQRYFHTKAGTQAALLLANLDLETGRADEAAYSYSRLLNRPDAAEELGARTLYRAAVAFRRAEDPSLNAKSEELLGRALALAPAEGLVLGRRTYAPDELRAEFAREAGRRREGYAAQVSMRYGDPAHAATGAAGTPFLDAEFRVPMLYHDPAGPDPSGDDARAKEGAEVVRQALRAALAKRDGPAGGAGDVLLPGFFPLSAPGTVLYRSYDGVYAVAARDGPGPGNRPARAGELVWFYPTPGGAQTLFGLPKLSANPSGPIAWWAQFWQARAPGLVFENTGAGSMSHDGRSVYVVDDLAVPPPGQQTAQNQGQPVGPGGDGVGERAGHSTLHSLDLVTGKREWELGGPPPRPGAGPAARPDAEPADAVAAFENAFVLGPPVSVEGLLYALVERAGAVRLVCLDPARPAPHPAERNRSVPTLVWSQLIGEAAVPLRADPGRRTQAAYLTYSNGVMLCPTNCGVLVAVDLDARGLLWARYYGAPAPEPGVENGLGAPGVGRRRNFNGEPPAPVPTERWRAAAPMIQGERVVFAAHDSDQLQCLNLRTGELLWRAARKADDLYVAAATPEHVLVVGKSSLRAYALAGDGARGARQAWAGGGDRRPLRARRGRGRRALLPAGLRVARRAQQAAGLGGRDRHRSSEGQDAVPPAARPRRGRAPGAREPDVPRGGAGVGVAARGGGVHATRTQAARDGGAAGQEPRRPRGAGHARGDRLRRRGDAKGRRRPPRRARREPRPVRGPAGARQALPGRSRTCCARTSPARRSTCRSTRGSSNSPPTPRRGTARRPSGRSANWPAARASTTRWWRWGTRGRDVPWRRSSRTAASPPPRPTGRPRPPTGCRGCACGPGSGRAGGSNCCSRAPSPPTARGFWNSSRRSTPPRAPLPKLGRSRTSPNSTPRCRRPARRRGSNSPGGSSPPTRPRRSARRRRFSCGSASRPTAPAAGRALDLLSASMLARGRAEEAVGLARLARDRAPDAEVRPGKTGAAVYAELLSDRRLLTHLEPARPNVSARARVELAAEPTPPQSQPPVQIVPEGEPHPLYRRCRLSAEASGANGSLTITLECPGEPPHRLASNVPRGGAAFDPNARNFGFNGGNPMPSAGPAAVAHGQYVLLTEGHTAYCFDLAERREAWRLDLYGSRPPNLLLSTDIDAAGMAAVQSEDGRSTVVGRAAVVRSGYVCLMTRDGLKCVDPQTGVELWSRTGVSQAARLFGDDEHVFVVGASAAPAPGGAPAPGATNTLTLRAADGGSAEGAKDFAAKLAGKERLGSVGRRLLLLARSEPKRVELFDPLTREVVWKRGLGAGTEVVRSLEPGAVGFLDARAGSFELVEQATGKVVFAAAGAAEELKSQFWRGGEGGADGFSPEQNPALCFADSERVYLVQTRRPDPNFNRFNAAQAGGLRAVATSGPLFAFDRTTGKRLWYNADSLVNQRLILERQDELPVLVAAATQSVNAAGNSTFRVVALDKRTGKLKLSGVGNPSGDFTHLVIDPRAQTAEFQRADLKLKIGPDDPEVAGGGG